MTRRRFILSAALAAIGCSRKPAPQTALAPAAQTAPPPVRSQVTFALSEPTAVPSFRAAGGREFPVVKWSFRYRVTGQPDPDEWYMVAVDVGGVLSTRDVRGKDLKPDGVFEGQALVVKDMPASVTFTVYRSKGTSKNYGANPAGGPLVCPVAAEVAR